MRATRVATLSTALGVRVRVRVAVRDGSSSLAHCVRARGREKHLWLRVAETPVARRWLGSYRRHGLARGAQRGRPCAPPRDVAVLGAQQLPSSCEARVVPQGRATCVAVHGKPLPPRRSMTAVRLAVAAAESAVASTARHRDVQPTTVTHPVPVKEPLLLEGEGDICLT
eukprot:scaffold25021_cov61-Phaeocystis_antarctica.AAC.4